MRRLSERSRGHSSTGDDIQPAEVARAERERLAPQIEPIANVFRTRCY